MDNIVRNFEEIELTEAELEVIYGAAEPTLSSVSNISSTATVFGATVAPLGGALSITGVNLSYNDTNSDFTGSIFVAGTLTA
jgi:hypothetical protein